MASNRRRDADRQTKQTDQGWEGSLLGGDAEVFPRLFNERNTGVSQAWWEVGEEGYPPSGLRGVEPHWLGNRRWWLGGKQGPWEPLQPLTAKENFQREVRIFLDFEWDSKTYRNTPSVTSQVWELLPYPKGREEEDANTEVMEGIFDLQNEEDVQDFQDELEQFFLAQAEGLPRHKIYIIGWGMANDMEFISKYFDPLPYEVLDLQYVYRRVAESPKLGLAAAVKQFFGIVLDKKCQNEDWGVRPLPWVQKLYAMDDARWVHRLFAKLRGEILPEDFQHTRADWEKNRDKTPKWDPHGIKAGANAPVELKKIIRYLWDARDGQARDENINIGQILPTAKLVGLARILHKEWNEEGNKNFVGEAKPGYPMGLWDEFCRRWQGFEGDPWGTVEENRAKECEEVPQ